MALPSSAADQLPNGALNPSSTWGELNNMAFVIQQMIGRMQTATIVRVEACTNTGGLSPVGFVDVTPMVNQVDAAGSPTPHVTIFNMPYFRIQGGANGIIIDPEKGDIGIAVFASRDISKVKNTREQGNPGSHRQYSYSDGLYIGGVLNGAPEQYIQFNSSGIKVVSPNALNINVDGVCNLNASTVNLN